MLTLLPKVTVALSGFATGCTLGVTVTVTKVGALVPPSVCPVASLT